MDAYKITPLLDILRLKINNMATNTKLVQQLVRVCALYLSIIYLTEKGEEEILEDKAKKTRSLIFHCII